MPGGRIIEEPTDIVDLIRCTPDMPRSTLVGRPTLAEVRAKVEANLKNTYLRSAQAPVGVRATLLCWMELN